MASKFQSRLVGTILLVALGVIFLPDLFDGKKQHYQEQFASIPLQPEFEADEDTRRFLSLNLLKSIYRMSLLLSLSMKNRRCLQHQHQHQPLSLR